VRGQDLGLEEFLCPDRLVQCPGLLCQAYMSRFYSFSWAFPLSSRTALLRARIFWLLFLYKISTKFLSFLEKGRTQALNL